MSDFMPDLNVLMALTLSDHGLQEAAQAWYNQELKPTLRVSQYVRIGYLRLLTAAVSGTDVRTNASAWQFVDELIRDGYMDLIEEPPNLDHLLKDRGCLPTSSPKRWANAYLSAFAEMAGLSLVTFDAALAGYTPRSILLKA